MKRAILVVSTIALTAPAYASVRFAPPPEAQSLEDRFFAANPGWMGGPGAPVPCEWLPALFTFIVDWGAANPLEPPAPIAPPVVDVAGPPAIELAPPGGWSPPVVIAPPCYECGFDKPPVVPTPVPEASTWALMLIGFATLMWRVKCQRSI